jgi:putative ABC transport system ATP-binding protein
MPRSTLRLSIPDRIFEIDYSPPSACLAAIGGIQELGMGLLIHKLKKTFVAPDGSSVPVIDIPELYINDGEQVALIGTSGSGKTTLLHMIAGILVPDSGNIVFGFDPNKTNSSGESDSGIDLTQLPEPQRDEFRGRNIGYIFQTHHLLPGFTALENVLLGMSFTGRAHDRPWAQHLLADVGLSDRLHYRPQKLSVGQQQRVAVARALANRPKLVLADEPTGALDAANAQQVLELIRKLCTEVGSSLLLVSHDLDIARQLPRVLTLSEINQTTKTRGVAAGV